MNIFRKFIDWFKTKKYYVSYKMTRTTINGETCDNCKHSKPKEWTGYCEDCGFGPPRILKWEKR